MCARARPACGVAVGETRHDSRHHLSITAISGRVDAGERYEETSAERSADTSTRLSESVQTQTRDGAHHSTPLITRTLPHTHTTPHTRPNTRDARLTIHSSRVDSRQPTELYTRKLASTDRGVSACGLRRPKAANPPAASCSRVHSPRQLLHLLLVLLLGTSPLRIVCTPRKCCVTSSAALPASAASPRSTYRGP